VRDQGQQQELHVVVLTTNRAARGGKRGSLSLRVTLCILPQIPRSIPALAVACPMAVTNHAAASFIPAIGNFLAGLAG
jgi:hypothetical protein